MYHDLNNRVAVITGAGSGIGRACALRLNQEGCRLVLNDIDAAGLEETRTLLDTPEHALGLAADIGSADRRPALGAGAAFVQRTAHLYQQCRPGALGTSGGLP